jgi:hypothetical protein
MAIAPLYIYNIAMVIIGIGGIVGIASIVIHHLVTNK